jgi:glutathione S-transferase
MSSSNLLVGLQTPALYGPVLFWAVAIAAEIVFTGLFGPGAARKATGLKYPDMGNGRLATKLSDDQWTYFANAQRAHYNFIEGAPTILVSLLVAGLFYPVSAAYLGAIYFVGRFLYAYGYIKNGPKGRLAGVILVDIGLLGLLVQALYGSARLSGWVA